MNQKQKAADGGLFDLFSVDFLNNSFEKYKMPEGIFE
jgi:hypothetical protein